MLWLIQRYFGTSKVSQLGVCLLIIDLLNCKGSLKYFEYINVGIHSSEVVAVLSTLPR